jgi:hypothetical protein
MIQGQWDAVSDELYGPGKIGCLFSRQTRPRTFWRGVFAAIEHRALMVTAPLVHSAKDQDAHEDVSDVVNLCVGYISSKRRTKIVRMQFA